MPNEYSAWAWERACRGYGFVELPDPVTLFPQQIEAIEGSAREIDAARREALEEAAQILVLSNEKWGDGYNVGHTCSLTVRNQLGASIAAIRALASREPSHLPPPLEDPTAAMIERGQQIAAATGAALSEAQIHDIYQAMMDEWKASQEPKI